MTTLELDNFSKENNPFDNGIWMNLRIILGCNVWGWLLPIEPSKRGTDGMEFPKNSLGKLDEDIEMMRL